MIVRYGVLNEGKIMTNHKVNTINYKNMKMCELNIGKLTI